MLIYVDDIIVASSYSEIVFAFLNDLRYNFALKDIGGLRCFLGVKVKEVHDDLVLS
jgi:hypothetical protein